MKQPIKSSIESLLVKVFVFLIRVYQTLFSGIFGGTCKFFPSCSNYGLEAFQRHGFRKGFFLTVFRLSKCHPFNLKSGIDLVPEREHGQSTK